MKTDELTGVAMTEDNTGFSHINHTFGTGKHMDRFDHMEEIFMPDTQGNDKPLLPFSEYIVEWGYHDMFKESLDSPNGILDKMFKKHGKHYKAIYSIPCKGGAVMRVSVVCGNNFYSEPNAPYEVRCPRIDEDSDEPLRNQTDEDLMVTLAKLIAYAKEY
jgi:hypothetical protein